MLHALDGDRVRWAHLSLMGTPVIDGFEIVSELGRGGMGTVYLARQESLGRFVALKVIRPEIGVDDELLARFTREAQTAALSHFAIVPVHAFGEFEGTPFLVMTHMTGGSLRDKLDAAGSLTQAETADIGARIAAALGFAHEHAAIHRDVKPSNVLFDESNNAYLADFGVARLSDLTRMTRTTILVGTTDYLAPELSAGTAASPASDLYALGVTLYECLTGTTPFTGDDPLNVMFQHRFEAVPDLPSETDANLALAIHGCLEKDPEDRPASASEVAAVLRDLARDVPATSVGIKGGVSKSPQSTTTPRDGHRSATATRNPRKANSDKAASTSSSPAGVRTPKRSSATKTVARPRRVTPTPTPVPEPRARRAKRPVAVAFVTAALLVAVAAAAAMSGGSGSSSPSTAVAFVFEPTGNPGELSVNRTWTLAGENGNELQGEVKVRNEGPEPLTTEFDEVIPKSVAGSVDEIRFDPEPDEIVNPDPIVRYKVSDLDPGAQFTVRYSVDVDPGEGDPQEQLNAWANDQIAAEKSYVEPDDAADIKLESLAPFPPSLTLRVGDSGKIALSGQMSDGSPAAAAEISNAVWSSSSTSVVTVNSQGVATAVGIGKAQILVEVDEISARVSVEVLAIDAATSTTRPPKTTTTQPKTGTTKATSAPTTKPTTTTTKAATTTTKATTTTTKAPVKKIALSKGGAAPSGYWYSVTLSGFSPGTQVAVTCRDSVDTGGFWTQTFTISGSGTAGDSTLCYSSDGPDHWVTGGGVTSNHVTW